MNVRSMGRRTHTLNLLSHNFSNCESLKASIESNVAWHNVAFRSHESVESNVALIFCVIIPRK